MAGKVQVFSFDLGGVRVMGGRLRRVEVFGRLDTKCVSLILSNWFILLSSLPHRHAQFLVLPPNLFVTVAAG